jgi:hypothetical protein
VDAHLSQAHELDACVFEGYLTGLRDVGWAGDERHVRFGFAATTALFLGVGAVGPFLTVMLSDEGERIVENVFGCSREYLVDQFALLQNYLLDLGEEARELMFV